MVNIEEIISPLNIMTKEGRRVAVVICVVAVKSEYKNLALLFGICKITLKQLAPVGLD